MCQNARNTILKVNESLDIIWLKHHSTTQNTEICEVINSVFLSWLWTYHGFNLESPCPGSVHQWKLIPFHSCPSTFQRPGSFILLGSNNFLLFPIIQKTKITFFLELPCFYIIFLPFGFIYQNCRYYSGLDVLYQELFNCCPP